MPTTTKHSHIFTFEDIKVNDTHSATLEVYVEWEASEDAGSWSNYEPPAGDVTITKRELLSMEIFHETGERTIDVTDKTNPLVQMAETFSPDNEQLWEETE